MPHHPRPNPDPEPSLLLTRLAERPQIDFELEFYDALLRRVPDFADVLRAHASTLTAKGMLKEGLKVDQKLIQLRPSDPTAHYNLACRYALLKQPDLALTTLRRAIELGYRDFQYMTRDRDLDSIHKDPRFRDLIRQYSSH